MSIIVSDDSALLDIALIHRFLSEESAWARRIPFSTVEKAIRNSWCFGAYEEGAQVGFARLVTDRATYAYLSDVFILEAHRGKGISRQLLDAIMSRPEVQGLRRFNLATTGASGLYQKFGWKPLAMPEIHMERYVADIYQHG